MNPTDVESILIHLHEGQVEFVVIGGVAALAHGSARVTFDVDVCYRRTRENVDRLCKTLVPLKPNLRGAPEGLPFKFDVNTVLSGLNFTLVTELGDLDLLGEVAGLGEYDAVENAAEILLLYGRSMKVITIEGLLKAKRAANRRKDQEAIVELEALLEMQQKQK